MPERVAAMVLEAFDQPLQLRQFPLPEPESGGVIVHLLAAGVCGSDLDIVAGLDPRVALPLIPGHEGIGSITALGAEKCDAFGEPLHPGDLVAFNRGLTCGRCPACAIRRRPALCSQRRTYGISLPSAEFPHLNGCYAETIYLRPATDLIKLPPDVEPVALVAATCSGATAAHAVELCQIQPADVAVVLGPGPLGLYAAAFAFHRGAAAVIMIGTGSSPRRLQLAASFGCLPVSISDTNATERRELVGSFTHGLGAAVVIDCAGNPASLREALALVAPGGTVAVPGVATPETTLETDAYLLARKQIRLQGVWVSDTRHLHQALTLANSNRYPFDALVTHVLPLRQANEALDLLRRKEAVKVVLTNGNVRDVDRKEF